MKQLTHILNQILGGAGWLLLVIVFSTILVTALYFPLLLTLGGLTVPRSWALVTFNVVRFTVAAWVASLMTSIARVVVWMRFKLAMVSGEEWNREREDVLSIQKLSVWLLGLFTVLAAYLTQWFGGE
jgi:hypothetical protein